MEEPFRQNLNAKMTNFEEKSRLIVTDFLWSLFISAMHTYRYDFLLRPFPNMYLKTSTDEKDIGKLRKDASKVPAMDVLLENARADCVPPESLKLFDWFLSSQNFKLQFLEKKYFSHIQQLTGQTLPASPPDFIFEVIPPHNHQLKFNSSKDEYGAFYAYHGSRLENFYSILHNGLASHLCKNGLFGSGIYLSSELSLSLLYSPSGRAWDKSILGLLLSCVAVCEVIKHPAVNYCVDGDSNCAVPEKYYVVQNNEMLRVCFLLVYGNSESNIAAIRRNSWWKNNKLVIASIFYIVILLIIGASSSNYYLALKKYFS